MPNGTAMRLLSRHRLRKYLDLLELSERELARQAGLGHATVNFLVAGHRTTCTEDTARAIEAALDVEFGDLFAPIAGGAPSAASQVMLSRPARSRGRRHRASQAGTC